MGKLLGDNYFNPATKKGVAEGGKSFDRAFNSFVLNPILKYKKGNVFGMLEKFDIKLIPEEKELEDKALLKVMKKFLPAGDSLLEMIVINLPSPATTQCYHQAYPLLD